MTKCDAIVGATSSKYTPTIDDYGKYLFVVISKDGYVLEEVLIQEISKQDLDVDVTLSDWTYGDEANKVVVTGNEGNGDVTVTYATELDGTYTSNVPTNTGTYYVKVTIAETDGYFGAEVIKSFKIVRKTITVIVDKLEKTYGDDDPELTYKVSGLVGSDELNGELSRREGKNAGTYDITQGTLTNENNPNYNITFVGNTLTINRKEVLVKAKNQWKTYNDLDPKLSYVAIGLAYDDTLTGKLTRTPGENVGEYKILAGTLTDEFNENYTIKFVSNKFSIIKKKISVTVNDVTKTYGDDDPVLTYTVEGLAPRDSLTGSLIRIKGEDVGTYYITIGTLSAGSNYTIVFQDGTLTINPKDITVKANDVTKTYGDSDPILTYIVDGLVEGDTLTGSLSRTRGENVGTYKLEQGTLSSEGNYNIAFTPATLTITAKNIIVKANDQKKVLGTNDPELSYTVDGLVGNDTLTGSLSRDKGETKGTYAITQGTLTSSDNYVITFTGAILTIYEGKVETEISVGQNAPKTTLGDMSENDLNSLLTDKEKEALKEGESVKVYVKISALDEKDVPANDKNSIDTTAKKSKMKVGMYLNLSLFKQVGNANEAIIDDAKGCMFKLTITIPEELRNTNPKVKRTFYVLCANDGQATVLGESSGDTLSFETDKSSTYALSYKDESTTQLTWLWIVLSIVAIIGIGFGIFFVIKKKNENKEESNEDSAEVEDDSKQ